MILGSGIFWYPFAIQGTWLISFYFFFFFFVFHRNSCKTSNLDLHRLQMSQDPKIQIKLGSVTLVISDLLELRSQSWTKKLLKKRKENYLLLDLGVCDRSPEGLLWLGFLLRGRIFSTCAVSQASEAGGGLGELVKSIILLEVFRRFLLGLSLWRENNSFLYINYYKITV